MNDFFADCPNDEPSSLLGFSGNVIDSNVETRTDNCLTGALDNDTTKYLAFAGDGVIIEELQSQAKGFMSATKVSQFDPNYSKAIMLGELNGKAIVALPVAIDVETLTPPFVAMDARKILYASMLPVEEAGAIGMAFSLLYWHESNQYCGKCGAASLSKLGGMRRDCASCGSQIFPRTDPAVIMLAVMGDKCLMGRGPHFPPDWYSCLAGFIEPGESLEQGVRREIFEESGIKIGRVKYFASQPWPFPHSLMIGAFCEALSDNISFDCEELEDCRWFGRDEVIAMMEKRHPQELRMPPSKSIAAHIIKHWINQGK